MSVLSYFSGIENVWLNKLVAKLTSSNSRSAKSGNVYIIGAGPGDTQS